jgi:hypothetical protein
MQKQKKAILLAWVFMIAAGQVFAAGSMQGQGQQRQSTNEAARRDMMRRSQEVSVANAADILEVEDRDISPDLRRNPKTGRAMGDVWAEPAAPIAEGNETERLPLPVYAVSGVKGQEILPGERVDIVVRLPDSEKFVKGLIEGENVSEWIENLPPGLTALARGVRVNDTAIRIYITGKPAVTGHTMVRVNIPESYLAGGIARQFRSPTEEENIRAFEASQTGADTGASAR